MQSDYLQKFYRKNSARVYPSKNNLIYLEEIKDTVEESPDIYYTPVKTILFNYLQSDIGGNYDFKNMTEEQIDFLISSKEEEIYNNTYNFINALQFPLTIYRNLLINAIPSLDGIYSLEQDINKIFSDHIGIYWSLESTEKAHAYFPSHLSSDDQSAEAIVLNLTSIIEDENNIDWEATAQIYTMEPELQEIRLKKGSIFTLTHLTVFSYDHNWSLSPPLIKVVLFDENFNLKVKA